MSLFKTLLALHLISVISWMAGILYLIRLFVYHSMEAEPVVRTRFKLMETRLYRFITVPAMVAAIGLGGWMLILSPGLLDQRWMQLKLGLAVALIIATLWAGRCLAQFAQDIHERSHRFYRVFNEVPTLIMIIIVFLVILRPALT